MSLLGVLVFFFFNLFYFFLACSLMMLHTRALVRAVRSAPFRSLSSKKKKLYEDFHGAVQVLIIRSLTYHKCLRLSILTTCSRRNSITL